MKTKELISTVTMQLISGFVFAYTKSRFSHDRAHYVPPPPIEGAGDMLFLVGIPSALLCFQMLSFEPMDGF